MPQQHHSDIHFSLSQLALFVFQTDAIFLVNIDVFIVRDDTQNGDTADIFEHLTTFLKEAHVASELIDNDAFNEFPFFRTLQHDAAIDAGKDASSVDIAHEDNISLGVLGHGHIHEVAILEVYLCNTACTLHHDRVIFRCQTVEGGTHLSTKVKARLRDSISLHTTLAPKVVSVLIANGFAVENDL